jgi:protein phosphatase 2C family protein 2/3
VYPGRLSVSRAFGNISAKDPALGGLSKVIISEPEIRTQVLEPDSDFIVMGSDGIFDRL